MNADERAGMMETFRVYRRRPPEHYEAGGFANKPDEPQYEGVIFSDGTVAVRWLTDHRSTSLWSSWDELVAVHGHPEYDTVFERIKVSELISENERLRASDDAWSDLHETLIGES